MRKVIVLMIIFVPQY